MDVINEDAEVLHLMLKYSILADMFNTLEFLIHKCKSMALYKHCLKVSAY